LLDVAVAAARRAVAVVRARAPDVAQLHWDEKGPSDFVTDVDRAAEHALRTEILGALPDARVLGEELSPTEVAAAGRSTTRDVLFVADPLDGTTNFLHGYPAYAVSIAVLVDGELTAAVVINAVTGDTYTATAGHGAWRNGEPMNVSKIVTPSRALIGTGFPFSHLEWLDSYQPQFAAVARQTAGIRRAGSAALDLADVACGRFEGFWELMLAPWDIAAGILLIREAGGIVTDLAGEPAYVAHTPLVAGNPVIHAWLLGTLARASPTVSPLLPNTR